MRVVRGIQGPTSRLALLAGFATLLGISQAKSDPPNSIRNVFYKSLADGIERAKGTAIVTFTAGSWKTHLHPPGFPATDVVVTFPAGERAIFDFDYEGGVLQQGANVEFRPPIEVTAGGAHVDVQSINYDEFGHASIHYQPPAAPMAVAEGAYFEETFTADRRASSLLPAAFFRNLSTAAPCQNHNGTGCTAPTPIIAEIDFEEKDDAHPGLLVSFKDRSVITFDGYNRIAFDGPAVGIFSQLSYDPTHQTPLTGRLDNLTANLGHSQIRTTGLALDIGAGLSMTFGTIDFGPDNDDPTLYVIQMANTNGDLSLGGATSVSLKGKTQFIANAGSNLHAVNWGVKFPMNSNPVVSVGAGSILTLDIGSGVFEPGLGSIADVSSGHVSVLLDGGAWNGKTPQTSASLTFSDLNLVLSGGQFSLNDSSQIAIGDGSTVAAEQLVWAAANPGFEGQLSAFDVRLQLVSPVNLTSGFQIAANANSHITMPPEHPIALHAGAYPSGGFKLDGNFSAFRDTSNPTFGLKDGLIHLAATIKPDGSYSIDNTSLDGLMTLNAGVVSMLWDVHLHDVKGQRTAGGQFQGSGGLAATIRPGWNLPFTTPAIYHTQGHDDMRIYPVTMVVKSNNSTNIPDTAISFGSSFSLASQANPTKVDLPLVVTILGGNGEHQQPDDQESSADGTHGPNQDQHRQEVFTDTFVCGRAHLYVVPGDYNLTASLNFAVYPQYGKDLLSAGINNINLQQDVGFDRDGCSAGGILTGVLGVVGFLTGGPFGGVVGGAIGHVAGGRVDDAIDARIETGVRDYIDGKGRTWAIALP